jgi:hypothetical protein
MSTPPNPSMLISRNDCSCVNKGKAKSAQASLGFMALLLCKLAWAFATVCCDSSGR